MTDHDPAQRLSDHLAHQFTLNTNKAELALGRKVRVPLDKATKDLVRSRDELVRLLDQAVTLNPNLLRGLAFQPHWVGEFGGGEWQVLARRKG